MTLTKADLVQSVYQKHDLTKAQAAEAVESFLQIAKRRDACQAWEHPIYWDHMEHFLSLLPTRQIPLNK